MNLKDEFMETLTIFFDMIVLNVFFYVITVTSFSFLLIPTLFIFSNMLYRNVRKNTKSLFYDLRTIVKRDFFEIIKHNIIQWGICIAILLATMSVPTTTLFCIIFFPYAVVFWYMFINRDLTFLQYYTVTLKIICCYPLTFLLLLILELLLLYFMFFMNGLFLIILAPVGFVFLLLFIVDRKVLKLEARNASN